MSRPSSIAVKASPGRATALLVLGVLLVSGGVTALASLGAGRERGAPSRAPLAQAEGWPREVTLPDGRVLQLGERLFVRQFAHAPHEALNLLGQCRLRLGTEGEGRGSQCQTARGAETQDIPALQIAGFRGDFGPRDGCGTETAHDGYSSDLQVSDWPVLHLRKIQHRLALKSRGATTISCSRRDACISAGLYLHRPRQCGLREAVNLDAAMKPSN